MIVSGPVTHTIHNHRENTILREFHPLTTFCSMTLRLTSHNSKPFFVFDTPRPETRLPLARLVKAEIVSPYRGILINAGMGNPTVSFIRPLGIGEFSG